MEHLGDLWFMNIEHVARGVDFACEDRHQRTTLAARLAEQAVRVWGGVSPGLTKG